MEPCRTHWFTGFRYQECRKGSSDITCSYFSVCVLAQSYFITDASFRIPQVSPFAQQINEALTQQSIRMDRAASDEKNKVATDAPESKKRPGSLLNGEASDAKRPRLEQDASDPAASLASFDFTALPAALITELIVANLQAFTESQLAMLVQTYRQSRGISDAPSASVPASDSVQGTISAEPTQLKEEHIDPLKMDIDEEEIEYEPDRLNLEVRNEHAFNLDIH
jgi:symplekin